MPVHHRPRTGDGPITPIELAMFAEMELDEGITPTEEEMAVFARRERVTYGDPDRGSGYALPWSLQSVWSVG